MDKRTRDNSWFLALLLVVVTFLAYQPVWQAGFVWDDDFYVTNNLPLRSLDGLRRIWSVFGTTTSYYPLTYTTFWIEYHLWGLRPLGYHLVNVSLHAFNAVLVWLVLRKLAVRGAWLAAAIFALHPVHVESVAWITERKNLLSGFLYLCTLLAYLRFLGVGMIESDSAARTGPRPWRFYWLALTLYLCALFAKTVTCTLPLVVLLLAWWKRGRIGWRDVGLVLPFLAFAIALGLTTRWAETVETQGWNFSVVDRFLIAGRNLWFYAGKLAWPRELTFVYPRWQIDASLWWQYLYPLSAIGVLLGLWARRERWGRGPLVAVLFFAGTLSVALGFFNIFYFRYSFVADHFQYLASLGIIVLGASGIEYGLRRSKLWQAPAGDGICLALLAVLAILTARQASAYRDAESLWQDTVNKNPAAWLAHNNLANELKNLGKVPEATHHYELALQLNPDSVEIHNNLGLILERVGRISEAIQHYKEALRLKPDDAGSHYNLGAALARTGDTAGAIQHFQQALRFEPNYAEAYCGLGVSLWRTGRQTEAIVHWDQALRLKPDYAEAHNNLGAAFMKLGKPRDAVEHLDRALQIKPDYPEAQNNLAWLLATLEPADGGNPVRAVILAQRVCDQTGHRVGPYLDTLAVAYAATGRFSDATVTAEQAVDLTRAAGQSELANEIEGRLKLYRQGRAYRKNG